MAKRRFRSRGRFTRLRRRRTSRVRRTKKFVKRVVRSMQEIKWQANGGNQTFDATDEQIDIEVTPQFTQGVTKTNFLGRAIRYKFLQFNLKFNIFLNPIFAGPPAPAALHVRVMLYVKRGEPDTGPYTLADMLRVGGSGSLTPGTLSFVDQNAIRKIKDKSYRLTATNYFNITGLKATGTFAVRKRVFNTVPLALDSTTGTDYYYPKAINDRFYLAIFTDYPTPLQVNIGYQYAITVSYYDM